LKAVERSFLTLTCRRSRKHTGRFLTGVDQGYRTFGEGRRRRKGEEEEDGDDKR